IPALRALQPPPAVKIGPMRWLIVIVPLAVLCGCAPPATPREVIGHRPVPGGAMPQAVRAPHPRLMATAEDLARVKKLIETDPIAAEWSRRILTQARRDESAPPLHDDPAKGLEIARELQKRITHLAMAYRLSGEQKYFEAGRRELLAAAALPA